MLTDKQIDNHGLWVEKYRPKDFNNYIGNTHFVEKCKIWLEKGEIPNLLLYSKEPGLGKTSSAKILANNLDASVLYINGSDENGVDTIRDKIKSFASTLSFSRWKICIIDEFDYVSINGQAILRNLMETFSATTRFILTCNYIEKIIEPIQSRCQSFNLYAATKKEIASHIINILNIENITYDITDLSVIIKSGYPDLRTIINTLQSQIVDNKLIIDSKSIIQSDYMNKVVDILKDGDVANKKKIFTDIRQIIADTGIRDFTGLYRYLYDNIEIYSPNNISSIILIIAEAQYMDSLVVDKEINIMAMILKIISKL